MAPDREDVVVSVGKELYVLMPLDRVTLVEPLEVQFGVVKDDIGTCEIGVDPSARYFLNASSLSAPAKALFAPILQAAPGQPQGRSVPYEPM